MRIRFYWSDIDAVLADMRSQGVGPFHATLDGNFPAIVCESAEDLSRLQQSFPRRP